VPAEDKQYGGKDLEEHGGSATITREAIQEQVKALDTQIATATQKRKQRKVASLKKKLEAAAARIDKYEQQITTAGNRSGYNTTDEDASAMMMKNKVEVLPAYNMLAGSEGQFITGVSVHQTTNDGACFKEHLQQVRQQQPATAQNIIADAIFGTEQNYELMEEQGIGNYLKYPSFHNEQKRSYRSNPFLKDNFPYDSDSDTYRCPEGKELVLTSTYYQTHKRTGYRSQLKEYTCTGCSDCPFYDQCCKSTKGRNRTIQVNEKLERYRQQARQNLQTDHGKQLRKRRSTEIESCFGDIKHNMGFRRFYLRGLRKVNTEFTLIAMAHNLRKLHLKVQKAAA
jgi:hypothetical protein